MGVSPFSLFIRDPKTKAALKGMPIVKRGKKSGELYRALSVADKLSLAARGSVAVPTSQCKVTRSVLEMARGRGVPVDLVKKHWHSTKGSTTLIRLRSIAARNNVSLALLTPRSWTCVVMSSGVKKLALKGCSYKVLRDVKAVRFAKPRKVVSKKSVDATKKAAGGSSIRV